jgi:hypothetical protein
LSRDLTKPRRYGQPNKERAILVRMRGVRGKRRKRKRGREGREGEERI